MLSTVLQTNTMSKLRLSAGLCLLLGLVGTAPAVEAQEVQHAPTVEQCRADQKIWLNKVKKLWQAEQKSDAASIILQESISLKDLTDWGLEMIDCQGQDPQFFDLYYKTSAEITFAETRRIKKFLERHDLYKQFEAEDAQGKR
jgi:hypothetical protein